jgi:RNA-directed DNA polymerase
MHENRETSRAPRLERERGRSAKAQSHKADAHALEESDRAILSMNQTNKEEQSSAESGEKRVRAKENIVQSDTNPTQSGERVSQGLSGVRVAAFLANHPRWEPYAVMPLVRFCAGGDQRWSSLPRHLTRSLV